MPTRLLKESIHQSERLNKLTDFQFRLWVSLITYVDDYGRGDARPAIIKGTCFPLRERLTNADIDAALQSLAGAGCVGLYTVDGKPYLYFPRWESHQNIRNKKSKFPAPPGKSEACERLKSVENICTQTLANVPVIQSNPNPNPNPIRTRTARARAREDADPADFSADDDFETFWAAYPRKTGDIRAACTAFFCAIDSGATLNDMLAALEWQRKSKAWTEQEGRYIPSADHWLSNRGWTQKPPASAAVAENSGLSDNEKLAHMRRMHERLVKNGGAGNET